MKKHNIYSTVSMFAAVAAVNVALGSGAHGQTIYDWKDTAPDGNWSQDAAGARWWDNTNSIDLWDIPPTGGVLRFNNNAQLTMSNNAAGTYSATGIIFGSGATDARTLGGNPVRFYDFSGSDPFITNDSSATHIINLDVEGDGDAADPLKVNINGTGGLSFGGGINNQGSWIDIGGTSASAHTVTFSGIVSGAGGLSSNSAQAMVVLGNSSNSYSGGTSINAGTISFANGSLGGTGTITMNGGKLQWATGNTEDISSRLTMVNTKTAAFDTNGNNVTLASVIGGGTSGSLVKAGAGVLTLSGANTYTGAVNVEAGTLKIGNNYAFGPVNTAVTKVTVSDGATVDFNGVIDAGYGYTITGTGVGGAGALVNSGAGIGTYFRQTTNLKLAGNASIGGTGEWGLVASGWGATNLDLGGYTLTKLGTNTFSLVNTTLTAGTLAISAGTVMADISPSTGASTAVTLANTAGVTLGLATNFTIGSLAGGGATGGTLALGGSTLTVGALNTSTTFSGLITDTGAGKLVKNGTGTLTLTRSSSIRGGLTVNAGKVSVANNAWLIFGNPGAEAPVTLNAGGVLSADNTSQNAHDIGLLTMNGGTLTSANGPTGPANDGDNGNWIIKNVNVGGTSMSTISSTTLVLRTNVVYSNNNVFTVNDVTAGTDLLISSKIITGGMPTPFTINKAGAGTMELTNANTYTGGTSISAGTLMVSNTTGSATGTGAVSLSAGATLAGAGGFTGALTAAGVLAPGSISSIASLEAGSTTWNGSAANAWKFNLASAAGSADALAITGNFIKGTGSAGVDYQFDFLGSAPGAWGNTYTLVTWTGSTTFMDGSDFGFSNLTGSQTNGYFTLNSNSLTFTAIPEPSSVLAGILISAGLLRRRRI